MKSTIEEINIIIEWWKNLPKDYNDITNLLYMQQKLSGYSYSLAGELADYKTDYNMFYYWRKINTNRAKNTYIKAGKSASAATSFAEQDTQEDLRKEIDSESIAYRVEILLKQIDNILNSLTMRVSYLKRESERTRFENNL